MNYARKMSHNFISEEFTKHQGVGYPEDSVNRNSEIISRIMGSPYLTESEIRILSSRKISILGRGLTSNEILSYIFFKLHAQNGRVKLFSQNELSEYANISSRDVYHVLASLRKAGLIGIEKRNLAHTKTIIIRHYSKNGPSGRFLSLNRTFFHKDCEDYEAFKNLSAGAKSAFIYLLFREKFRKNEDGVTVTKSYGNSIEVTMNDIIKITKVQKETAILYVKNINDNLHNFLNIVPALYGNANDRRTALLQDKRVIYGAVTSSAARRKLSTIENRACGFWRMFDMWLQSHGYKKDPILAKEALTKAGDIFLRSDSTSSDRLNSIRASLFSNIIHLLKEGINWMKIYNEINSLIRSGGGLHESVPYYLYATLSPYYQSKTPLPE